LVVSQLQLSSSLCKIQGVLQTNVARRFDEN
jgi:hypothetical protein